MPFIRYRTGDSVVRGVCPCPCGAQWATLTRIHGRLLDQFYFPDGSVLDASTVDQNLRKFAPWVRRYQVVQDSLTLVTIKAEPWKVFRDKKRTPREGGIYPRRPSEYKEE